MYCLWCFCTSLIFSSSWGFLYKVFMLDKNMKDTISFLKMYFLDHQMCYMFSKNEFCGQISFLNNVFGRVTVSFSIWKALGRSVIKRLLKNLIRYFPNLFENRINFAETTLNFLEETVFHGAAHTGKYYYMIQYVRYCMVTYKSKIMVDLNFILNWGVLWSTITFRAV